MARTYKRDARGRFASGGGSSSGGRSGGKAAAKSKPAKRSAPKTTSARGRALQNQRRAAALVSASRGGRGPSAKAVRSVLTAQRARAFYAATGGGKKRSAVKPAAKKTAKATAAAVRARTKAGGGVKATGMVKEAGRSRARPGATRNSNARQRALINYNNALRKTTSLDAGKKSDVALATARRALDIYAGKKPSSRPIGFTSRVRPSPSKPVKPASTVVKSVKKAKPRSSEPPKQASATVASSNTRTSKSVKKQKNNKGAERAAKNYLLALKEVMGPAGGRKRKRVLTGKTGRRLATAARALDYYTGAGKSRTRTSVVADKISRILRIADKVRKSQSRASKSVALSREAMVSRLTEKAARLARGPRLSRLQRDIAMDAKREHGIKSTGRKRR